MDDEDVQGISPPDDDEDKKKYGPEEDKPYEAAITPMPAPAIQHVASQDPVAPTPTITAPLPDVNHPGQEFQAPAAGPQRPPTPAEHAISGLSAVQKQNPYAMLVARDENIHNPFLRILAKLGTGAGAFAEGVGNNYPAIQQERIAEANQPAQAAGAASENQLRAAQTSEAGANTAEKEAETARLKNPVPKLSGEPISDGQGGFLQLDENKGAYVPVPSLSPQTGVQPTGGQQGGFTPPAGPAGPQTPVAGPQPFGTKIGTIIPPERAAVPTDQVQSFPKDIKAQYPDLSDGQVKSLTAELGPNPTQADMAKVQAAAESSSKGNQATSATAAQREQTNVDRERTALDREKAADEKEAEKKAEVGWAVDKQGNKVLTNKSEAEQNGYGYFQKTTPTDVEKDEATLRQMNDVQLNTSRYKQAVNALSGPISKPSGAAITRILSDKDLNGFLTSGATLGVLMDQINQGEQAKAWNDLSPQEQNVVTGYLRAKSSVLAYQKALTNTGRTNKEQMDIEMNNLPSPLVGATVANPRFDAFQENIDTASKGFGKIPWMDTPDQVRQRIEGANTATGAQQNAGGFSVPQGAPPAKGVPDGKVLKQGGKVVAVAKGGAWTQP